MTRHGLALAAVLLTSTLLLFTSDSRGGKKPRPPPEPASPAIAWESRGDLWVADEDGANATRLLEAATPWWPSWSPDGGSIAYVEGLRRLWRVDIDVVDGTPRASNLTLLAESATTMTSSRWSPKGDEILFRVVGPSPDHVERLQVVPAGGGEVTTLYVGNGAPESFGAHDPAWSPDGSRIALTVHMATGMDVKILDRATRTVTDKLPIGGGTDLDWARTQDVIAYERGSTIMLLDLETGQTTSVAEGRWPSWAPDDSVLVYVGDLGKKNQGLVSHDLGTGTDTFLLRDRYARFADRRR